MSDDVEYRGEQGTAARGPVRRRRRTALIGAVMTAGAGALLAPTLFQSASAAETREFSADVRTGVQIYECRVNTEGVAAFTFKAPRAELQRAIHHDAGPVWQAPDGSAVKGTVVSVIPRAGTIPELTLSAQSIGDSKGTLSGITTIRRVDTGGGLAPTGSCQLGQIVEVPYTATYVFSGVR